MLQRVFQIRYHLPEGMTFHNAELMLEFLNEVAEPGYRVVALSEHEPIYSRGRDFFAQQTNDNGVNESDTAQMADKDPDQLEAKPSNQLTQGVSLLARSEALKFVNDPHQHLWLAAFPVVQDELSSSFSCGLAFPTQFNTSSVMITLTSLGFANKLSDALTVFEKWLELFSIMWRVWQPFYAHSYAPLTDWPEPADADVQASRLPYLYEINLLSAKLVDVLGRERVLQTPAWRVRPDANDSILLIPEFIFTERDSGQGELAAQHLGMSKYFRGEYLPISRRL